MTGRRLVLGNGDVRISYAVAGAPSRWYRNGIGDECVYVERGAARVETVFGAFDVGEGDYVVIPRATTHRWIPKRSATTRCAPTASRPTPTSRRRSATCRKYGQLLEHAPYCERDLRAPEGPLLAEDVGAEAGGRDRGLHQAPRQRPERASSAPCTPSRSTRSTSSAGTAASTRTCSTCATSSRSPAACTSRRRCTRSSRAGTSSSATSCRARSTTTRCRSRCPTTTPTSTATRSCSTSTATTRRARARASRKGSISVHPGGHAHGPQPGASEGSIGVDYFDELAVMVDTFRPLELGEGGRAVDDGAYAWSWAQGRGEQHRRRRLSTTRTAERSRPASRRTATVTSRLATVSTTISQRGWPAPATGSQQPQRAAGHAQPGGEDQQALELVPQPPFRPATPNVNRRLAAVLAIAVATRARALAAWAGSTLRSSRYSTRVREGRRDARPARTAPSGRRACRRRRRCGVRPSSRATSATGTRPRRSDQPSRAMPRRSSVAVRDDVDAAVRVVDPVDRHLVDPQAAPARRAPAARCRRTTRRPRPAAAGAPPRRARIALKPHWASVNRARSVPRSSRL